MLAAYPKDCHSRVLARTTQPAEPLLRGSRQMRSAKCDRPADSVPGQV